jgi:hypothetical protein
MPSSSPPGSDSRAVVGRYRVVKVPSDGPAPTHYVLQRRLRWLPFVWITVDLWMTRPHDEVVSRSVERDAMSGRRTRRPVVCRVDAMDDGNVVWR